jgi:hypothetical protein
VARLEIGYSVTIRAGSDGEVVTSKVLMTQVSGREPSAASVIDKVTESDLDSDIRKFKFHHNLKQDISLNLARIENDNTVTLRDGRMYGLGDLEGVNVYAPNAQYILDGETIALPSAMESRTFMGKVGGETIMITKGKSGEILTMDIFGLDGSDEYMATVKPGLLATITPDNVDEESLRKFTMDDMVFVGSEEDGKEPYERALKGAQLQEPHLRSRRGSNSSGGRSLQLNECSTVYTIQVAAAFDSTFCAKQGGASSTRQEIERIVARASAMYQLQGACTKLQISHLEGFCEENDDPYRAGVNLNHIGCGGDGLLDFFAAYWKDNRGSVSRDAAHLFYARDLAGSSIGCAYVNALCSKNSGYGVNEMEFSTDEQRRAIVFAHELGHNIGTSTWGRHILQNSCRISLCSPKAYIFYTPLSHFSFCTCYFFSVLLLFGIFCV